MTKTSQGTNEFARRLVKCVLRVAACMGLFAFGVAHADNPPADAIGAIEGEAISVDGPMTVEVVHGQVRTVLRSGSDVRVKAGQARVDLIEGGYILICGPAHFSLLKSGGSITLALDSGTIHTQIGSEVSLNIYTAQIQAHPISIGNGVEDLLVGLDGSGTMCLRANRGAIRVEQQLTGQSVIVPQTGDISLANGQLESLQTTPGHCVCDMQTNMLPLSPAVEVSQPATEEDIKRMAEKKVQAKTTSVPQTDQPEEPVYQVFMPPLKYDAKAKVQQPEYDPNMVILVRRVRVRPTLIYQGRVEGDATMAQQRAPVSAAKPSAASRPTEESTWNRVKNYIRRIWSPAT